MRNDKTICLGVVSGAHGIRGQVKIKSFTADPAALTEYGPLQDKHGHPLKLRVDGQHKESLIAWIDGVNDRNAAESLRGTELYIARAQLPDPEDEEFYYEDLIGLAVKLQDGSSFGKVRQIYNFGSGDMLEIEDGDGQRELIAFTRAQFPEIRMQECYLLYVPAEVIE